MANWNELFTSERNIKRVPEPEVYKFVFSLEELFPERPLRLWDLCCGAGRHTIAMARLGHKVYASDNAPNAIKLTGEWLAEAGLQANLALAEMSICPWPEVRFHGVMSWDALHHNTLHNIYKAVDRVYRSLVPGGLFMSVVKSSKADLYGIGQKIEPDTFAHPDGPEAGVPHHYFNEAGIRRLFDKWELLSLAEQVVTYVERGDKFVELNPFPYTTWCILVRKRAS